MINIDILNILLTGLILFSLDFIYLFINQDWYKYEIYKMQGSDLHLKWFGVFMRYLTQSIGLYIFVLKNKYSLLYSFIYGLIIYGNYIGTNYATVLDFDPTLATVDLIKGGCIMTLTSYIFYNVSL